MAAKRVYTNDEKAGALAALAANEGNVYKTARELGIPFPTLRCWAVGAVHPTVVDASIIKKGELAQRFGSFANRVLGLTTDDDIKAAPLKDRITSAAIAVDKMQVLTGEPTNITGQADSREQNLERIRELVRYFAAVDGGKPADRIEGAHGAGEGGNGTAALPPPS